MEIDSDYAQRLASARSRVEGRGVRFEDGMTEAELMAIEQRFAFAFPPDLKWFLRQHLPVGDRFPNWRGEEAPLRERIEWPADGICFDIRNKVFWWPEWGERPAADADAIAVASRYLERVPVLIPIFGHSYLPSTPAEVGNPVFSVHQADVIHRGADLAEYLHYAFRDQEEFDEDRYPTFSEVYRPIRFWSSMARENARQ